MPGGNNFLEALTCGQPVVTQGSSGEQLAINMKEGFDSFRITSKQIEREFLMVFIFIAL